jgi:hypothetical protein
MFFSPPQRRLHLAFHYRTEVYPWFRDDYDATVRFAPVCDQRVVSPRQVPVPAAC